MGKGQTAKKAEKEAAEAARKAEKEAKKEAAKEAAKEAEKEAAKEAANKAANKAAKKAAKKAEKEAKKAGNEKNTTTDEVSNGNNNSSLNSKEYSPLPSVDGSNENDPLNTRQENVPSGSIEPRRIDACPNMPAKEFKCAVYLPRTKQCFANSTVYVGCMAKDVLKIRLEGCRFGLYKRLWPNNIKQCRDESQSQSNQRQGQSWGNRRKSNRRCVELSFAQDNILYMTESKDDASVAITMGGMDVSRIIFLGEIASLSQLIEGLLSLCGGLSDSSTFKQYSMKTKDDCIRWLLEKAPESDPQKMYYVRQEHFKDDDAKARFCIDRHRFFGELKYDMKRRLWWHAHKLLQDNADLNGTLKSKCEEFIKAAYKDTYIKVHNYKCLNLDLNWDDPRVLGSTPIESPTSPYLTEATQEVPQMALYLSQENVSAVLHSIEYPEILRNTKPSMFITMTRVTSSTEKEVKLIEAKWIHYWRITEMPKQSASDLAYYSLTLQFNNQPFYWCIRCLTKERFDSELKKFHNWIGKENIRPVSMNRDIIRDRMYPINIWMVRRLYMEATHELKNNQPNYYTTTGHLTKKNQKQTMFAIVRDYKRLLRQLFGLFAFGLVKDVAEKPLDKVVSNYRFYLEIRKVFQEWFGEDAPLSYANVARTGGKPMFEYSWLYGQFEEPN